MSDLGTSHSRVKAISIFYFFLFVGGSIVAFVESDDMVTNVIFLALMVLIFGLPVVGVFKKWNGARIFLYFPSALIMLGVLVGTVIGFYMIKALQKSKPIFKS